MCVRACVFKGFHLFREKGLYPPNNTALIQRISLSFPTPTLGCELPTPQKEELGHLFFWFFPMQHSSCPLVPFQVVIIALANGYLTLSTSQSETS